MGVRDELTHDIDKNSAAYKEAENQIRALVNAYFTADDLIEIFVKGYINLAKDLNNKIESLEMDHIVEGE